MIEYGCNTVLFKKYSLDTAVAALKKIGYDGIEISAIGGMCDHLNPGNRAEAAYVKAVMEKYGMKMLSCEAATHDIERLKKIFAVSAEVGIPIVNIGPGGKTGGEGSLEESIETVGRIAETAKSYGVTLCCKAHVGCSVFDTPTTIKLAEALKGNPYFGIDMDPSHIYRAGEAPESAIESVVQYMKHVHIRDCVCVKDEDGDQILGGGPGQPFEQICGDADINLKAYMGVLYKKGYDGPVCLEVIGPELDLADASVVAAKSLGYLKGI